MSLRMDAGVVTSGTTTKTGVAINQKENRSRPECGAAGALLRLDRSPRQTIPAMADIKRATAPSKTSISRTTDSRSPRLAAIQETAGCFHRYGSSVGLSSGRSEGHATPST